VLQRNTRSTIRDVAAAAGVSVATVSYAFNRPERVAAVTRERVLATARALGYTGPDATARALRLGRPGMVALRGPGGAESILADPAATQVARGLAHTLDRADIALIFGGEPATPDGLVLFRGDAGRDTCPAVTVEPQDPEGELPAVRSLVADGAAGAARHLGGLGHTHLAVLAWDGCGPRLDGARRGWGDSGRLSILMAPGPGRRDGEPTARAALKLRPAPTAILALSDALAFEALDAAAHMGRRVPQDLSVAGVDDLPGADARGLTTVFVPYRPLGELAGGTLLALLTNRPAPVAPPLPSELVIRGTTAPPPAPD